MSKRKKIIISIMLAIFIFCIGIFVWLWYEGKISIKASSDYSAKLISQNPKGEIKLKQGGIEKVLVKFQNNGKKIWQKDSVYLKLKGNNNESIFYIPDNNFYKKVAESKNNTSGWLDTVSISFLEKSVKPGDDANFIFYIHAPYQKGNYKEIYQLVYNSNGKEILISNSEVIILSNISNNLTFSEYNKNSEVYKKIKKEYEEHGINIDKQQDIINIQKQIENSKNSSEKINQYKKIADLQKDENTDSAIESLKKAKEEAEKIGNTEEREKALKEIDEKIKNLEEQKKSDEETSRVSKEEQKVAEAKEAKTVINNQTQSSANKPVKVAGVTTGGLIGGAVAGGAVGSVVPGIGTAVGALGGALLGGLGGLIGGLLGF